MSRKGKVCNFLSSIDKICLLINDINYMAMLAAFLGNPGIKYEKTRHNYGKMVCSGLEKRFPAISWRKKFHSDFAELPVAGQSRTYLVCPNQYMNNSGTGVSASVKFFSIPMDRLIIVHDDLETPFGTYVFQKGGGLAGHNGLRSISGRFGSNDFYRLKMGIGRPEKGTVSSYVLGRFSPLEEAQLPDCIDSAVSFLCQAFSSENLSSQPSGKHTVFTS